MTLNVPGVIYRTAEDEGIDARQGLDNWLNQSWKDWPNEAQYTGLDEHNGPVNLSVKGTIPSWAAGSLFRTGPGIDNVDTASGGVYRISHWFDGIAHTHRFDIVAPKTADESVTVVYSSCRQSDGILEQIKKKGWRSSISFGQKADPCLGIFSKVMSFFVADKNNNNNNNNVVVVPNMPGLDGAVVGGHRGGVRNLYTLTDNASIQELDPKTLEPIGTAHQTGFHPDLRGHLSCAHAQRDPETGDLFNFNLELGPRIIYRIFRVNAATGTTDILATVSELDIRAAYIHSFFLTENYLVLCVTSAHYGAAGVKILWDKNLIDAIKPFDTTRQCKWIVVDRRHGNGAVAKFSTPAGFFFHSVNAFEELVHDKQGGWHNDIYLDSIQYPDTDIMHSFYYDVLLDRDDATKEFFLDGQRYKSIQPRLARYRFRIHSSGQTPEEAETAVAEEVLSIPSPHVGELPVIHPALVGKPYRYVYTAGSRGPSTFTDSIVKTDLHTRDAIIWSGPHGHSPSEPIFVPRPGAVDEDDGVILSLVLNGAAKVSYLLCLNARTLEELGRAEADFAIAMALHGTHVPAA